MLLHSCESISTRLEGTTSTSAECDQISIDHRPRALDGGAEVRESDIQASTDSPNRRRRNTARIDSKPANPLLIPSYAAGCVSQKNSPDLGGTPLTLTEVFGWMCVIPLEALDAIHFVIAPFGADADQVAAARQAEVILEV